MLLQVPPLTKESGEGIPIDTKTKAARHEGEQQLGGGGWQDIHGKKTISSG